MIIALDARPLVMRQIGGAEQHARNIVAEWARMDLPHRFLLFLDRHHTDAALYDRAFIDSLPKPFEPVLINDFHLMPRLFVGTRVFHTLSRTLNRCGATVYHSFTPLVPRTRFCPVVQTIHDLSYELDATVRKRPESRDLRRITRLGATWAARIIAVSWQTRNDITSLYHVPPERISVVPNGLNPAFEPQPQPELRTALREKYKLAYPYVLAVGSDIPRRNYARMLEAMQLVWRKLPELKWVLAGQNVWTTTPLYHKAQAANVLDKMLFVQGPVDTELAQLYRDATLTCCASSFEGFGMSVLESMACGTPVTCSDMRSLREVADDAAVYFPHDDPTAMGESIAGLLEDVEYRRQLKYRGLNRARMFTWSGAAQAILRVLEQTGSARA